MDWPFGTLRPLAYGKIIADPPWNFENWSERGQGKSPAAHYQLMQDDAIRALPVGHLAARDCALFMWCTGPRLDFGIEVLKGWGFRFVTAGTWHKTTKRGKSAWGPGYWLRTVSEPFILGALGDPPIDRRVTGRTPNLWAELRREHSRKPDRAHRYLDGILPTSAGCELFARESVPGWDAWGNEAGRFDAQTQEGPHRLTADGAPVPG